MCARGENEVSPAVAAASTAGLPGPPGVRGVPQGPAESSPPAPGWHLAYSSTGARGPASASSIPAGGGRLLRTQPAVPFGFAAAARPGRRLAAGPVGGNQGPACTLIGKRGRAVGTLDVWRRRGRGWA